MFKDMVIGVEIENVRHRLVHKQLQSLNRRFACGSCQWK